LNEADRSIAEALFRDPHQVVLLIQPAETGPANASFFFWDAGRINGDFPFLEFPFDAALLANVERHKIEAAQRRAAAVPPQPETAPRPSPGRGVRFRLSRKQAVWGILALSIVALALALRFAPQSFAVLTRLFPERPAPPPAATPHAIGLSAERQNDDLKVTWNRNSASVVAAISGALSIRDGNSRREMLLDAAQVRGGSILYSPVSDEVQIALTVYGPVSSSTESVIVINPRAGVPQVRVVSPPPAPARQTVEPQAPLGSASRQAVKPFTPPTAQPAPKPAQSVPDAPPTLPGPATGPVSLAGSYIAETPRLLPLDRQPLPAVARESAAQTGAPEVYHPPEVIREIMPSFPDLLKQVLVSAKTVEVKVSIDETGKVVKTEPVPQRDVHQLLLNAAAAAAREWKFRPARRGDRPMPSEMLLRFTFKPRV
jgi:protein TonB